MVNIGNKSQRDPATKVGRHHRSFQFPPCFSHFSCLLVRIILEVISGQAHELGALASYCYCHMHVPARAFMLKEHVENQRLDWTHEERGNKHVEKNIFPVPERRPGRINKCYCIEF